MSAIGDYIHYTSKGYATYGVAKFRETPKQDIDIFKKFKTKFLQQIQSEQNKAMSPNERLELRKKLSQILDPDVDRTDENNIISQIQNELEILVQNQAQKSRANAIVDFSTGDVSLKQAQSIALNKKAQVLSQIELTTNQSYITKATIDSRIKNIQNNIALIKSDTDKNTVKKQIQEIEEEYNAIQKDIANLRGSSQLHLTDKVKSLISNINSLLAAFSGTVINNIIKGDFMEYAVALSPLVGMNITQSETQKIIKELEKTKMGDARSTVKINADLFVDDIDFEALAIKSKGWRYDKNKKVFATIMPTQEKIDVNLSWNNTFIPTSIKNVNLSSGYDVHIVSNTSLLYLIQDSNEDDFINHYLNVVAIHNDNYSFDGNITTTRYTQAQNAMKLLILYKALSGKTAGRQAASIFIVNDNSKTSINSIQVYDIPSLVYKAANNIEAYTAITANGTDLAFMRLHNPWSSTYSERITTLIQDVHAQKISAALKPVLLQST